MPAGREPCAPLPTSAPTGSTSCSSSAGSTSSRCSPICTRSSASAAGRPARSRRSPPPASTPTCRALRETMESDDAAGLLLRFDGGARGVCTISQVSAGRRNRLAWEIDGDASALAWAADDPDHLWIGHRGRPNEIVEKDPALFTPEGVAATAFPGGHVEGYPDTFRALFTAIYADVAAGTPATAARLPDVCRRPRHHGRQRCRRHVGTQRGLGEGRPRMRRGRS